MGGFTTVFLRDKSQKNIDKHNEILKEFGVARDYHFYSEKDIYNEFEAFQADSGVFPEHRFPKDQIKSFSDFKKYWSTEALGEIFCPYQGEFTCDCYFGRMSKRAMRNFCKYLAAHHNDIESMGGSYETLLERGATQLEREIILKESGINFKY